MKFKMVVKKIIGLLQPSKAVLPNKSQDKIIEFVGPPGVGKSTLHLFVKNNLSKVYLGKENLNHFKLDENHILNSDFYWKFFKDKITSIDNLKINEFAKLETLNYFYNILLDNLIITQKNTKSSFFLDEGICNNFYKELSKLNKDSLSKFLKNRILIIVLPRKLETVVKQIKKRTNDTRQTVFFHRGLCENDLMQLTKEAIDGIKRFAQITNEIGIPILELYIEDGLDYNANKILDFETSLK